MQYGSACRKVCHLALDAKCLHASAARRDGARCLPSRRRSAPCTHQAARRGPTASPTVPSMMRWGRARPRFFRPTTRSTLVTWTWDLCGSSRLQREGGGVGRGVHAVIGSATKHISRNSCFCFPFRRAHHTPAPTQGRAMHYARWHRSVQIQALPAGPAQRPHASRRDLLCPPAAWVRVMPSRGAGGGHT